MAKTTPTDIFNGKLSKLMHVFRFDFGYTKNNIHYSLHN